MEIDKPRGETPPVNLPIKITIITNPKLKPLRVIYSTLWVGALIGVGIAADSAAMQWMGFVITIVLFVGLAIQANNKDEALTLEQARKRLDELERNNSCT